MSKARLITIAIVLILGGIWFFAPQSVSTKSTSSEAPAAADKSGPSFSSPASRKIAQAQAATKKTSPSTQHLPGNEALRALQAESIRPWTVRRKGLNEGIKTLVRGLWKSGNGSDIRGAANAFVHDYSESLLGVPSDQIRLAKEETTDRTKFVYDQYVNDTRVYGGTLTLFFEDGGLSRVQNDLVSKSTTLDSAPSDFTAAQAFAQFNESEGSVYTNLSSTSTETVLFPGSTSLVYSYDFNVQNTETGKTYRVLYDAESQALIKKFPTQVQ